MRFFIRILLPVTIAFLASASFAAETVHLFLKNPKGKTYQGKTDATGKFSFDKVEPGKYELIWILPQGTTPDNTESASIEIESFSWGETQMGHHGSTTSSNQRTVEPSQQAGTPVPVGGGGPSGPDGGGGAPNPQHKPPGLQGGSGYDGVAHGERRGASTRRSNIQNNFAPNDFQRLSDGKYYLVVLEEVIVSGVSTCEGVCGKMAINEKGVPVKKKSTTK